MTSNAKILRVTSSTKNLAKIRSYVNDKASEAGFDENTTNQIILAVDEACTNIIKYSHNFDDAEYIELSAVNNSKQFKINISYKGRSFNPNQLPEPDMEKYFKEHKVGGLGIPMMKKFMNKIIYSHNDPDINLLTLIKYIPNGAQ